MTKRKSKKVKKKYYSKNKCPCIAGKEIIGMGKSTDKHLKCHNCGSALFPWERHNKFCQCCQTNSYRDSDEPKDRMKMWVFPDREQFIQKEKQEERLKERLWKKNLTFFDKIKINLGIKCCNEHTLFTLDELKRGKK